MARTYTDTQKTDAVNLYVEHGLAEAHHRTGIPKPSLRNWARAAGHDTATLGSRAAEKTRAATQAHLDDAAEKRALLGRELLDAARIHVARSIAADNGKDAQHYMTAGAIGLDKFRLEQGEVTDRTEHVVPPERSPDVEEELAKLYDLAEHRAA